MTRVPADSRPRVRTLAGYAARLALRSPLPWAVTAALVAGAALAFGAGWGTLAEGRASWAREVSPARLPPGVDLALWGPGGLSGWQELARDVRISALTPVETVRAPSSRGEVTLAWPAPGYSWPDGFLAPVAGGGAADQAGGPARAAGPPDPTACGWQGEARGEGPTTSAEAPAALLELASGGALGTGGPGAASPPLRWPVAGRAAACLPPLADAFLLPPAGGEELKGALARPARVTLLLLALAPGVAPQRVAGEFADRVGALTWYGSGRTEELAAAAQAATSRPGRVALAAVLAAAALAVAEAALVLYYARRRRLGALAAAGADGSDLSRLFAGEVAQAALAGWAAGLAGACVWSWLGSPPGGSAVVLGAVVAALGVGLAVAVGVRGPGRELERASALDLLFNRSRA